MKFDEVIEKRQSHRNYAGKKVDWKYVAEIMEAGRKAPMAGNIFTVRFMVVTDGDKIAKIAQAAVQEFIQKASWLIIVCSENKRIDNAYSERGLKYSRQQAGAVIENMLLKITDLGLASCWIGAFDDEAVKSILNIPSDIEVEAIIPVAYGTKFVGESKRKKTALNDLVYFDKWGNRLMKPLHKVETR
jgi:nitroreductase